MQVETFAFFPQRGWTVPAFPPLDSPSTLVVVFGALGEDACLAGLAQLAAAYPRAHLIGCSTAGEILGDVVHDHSLVVAVCRFEATTLRSTSVPIAAASQSCHAGETIGRRLSAPDLRGVLVISDGISVNGSDLVRGLNATLPEGAVVTGGLAGDGYRFQETWVVKGAERERGHACAVGLYGEHLSIGYGSKGGWDVFGLDHVVTRSQGNVLYEIGDKPALDLYKLYLGDLASGLPANAMLFPLGLRRDSSSKVSVVRTILSIDESAGSMTFAGDVPEGSLVRFMRANFDRLVDGAGEAARQARGNRVSDLLAIAISCVGRRLVLGDRIEEEVEVVQESLPGRSPLVGFYSYGELSPLADGRCDLHNQTMTVTTLAES